MFHRSPRSVVRLAAAAVLAVAAATVLVPAPARAESECNNYCSGPGKIYKECMERCINRSGGHRETQRAIRDLCRSPGHDEQECLDQYQGQRRRDYDRRDYNQRDYDRRDYNQRDYNRWGPYNQNFQPGTGQASQCYYDRAGRYICGQSQRAMQCFNDAWGRTNCYPY